MTEASCGFSRAVAPVWIFTLCTTGSSGSLSCGAREVRFPGACQGGVRHCFRVMVGVSGSRCVEEGLSKSFSGCGRKPCVPSTCAGDLCELLRVSLRNQGYCGVGRGLSGLHQVWCNKRAPSRVEAGTSGFLSISDSDRRVPAEFGQESQASSCVEEWNSACLTSCSWGDRPLDELYMEPAVFSR